MNKTELASLLSQKLNMSVKQISKTIDEFFKMCVEVINKGEKVTIKNFATLKSRQGKSFYYTNPITKRRYISQPKNYIGIKLSKNFKFSIK